MPRRSIREDFGRLVGGGRDGRLPAPAADEEHSLAKIEK